MKKLTSNEIRNKWISFFESKGHKVMESAPLVPQGDDSLLFINAGVTPLKKYFDGTVVPDNKRIVTIQKCIRTNDIDNVGVTKSHQTFFEMMGNFSIGDYFKSEALEFAYEFLTSPEWMGIDKDKIYVTVYTKDDEAYNKWAELGLDKSHIIRLDGNFWEIGEGPCGPDSEIFYDRGVEYDKEGDAFLKFSRDEDQSRYIEIWNNVFSQFNSKNGVDRDDYQELPHKNIDTGAGLERWCCIFQGVDSTFETDLFTPIIEKIAQLAGKEYNQEMPYKVIADHIRAVVMALSDGAIFENTGRGYVLRRLLRRSVRMGKKLGINDSFLYKLVDVVVDTMKDSYKELVDTKAVVKTQILQEEELFHNTLEAGERKLYQLISTSTDKTISGYDVFKLYDTYGFPPEVTSELAQENNMTVDMKEFDELFKAHQEKSRMGSEQKFKGGLAEQNDTTIAYHTATHLLNAALKVVLGPETHQRGSNITIDRMRFDFNCDHKMTDEEKKQTEDLVNKWIQEALPVTVEEMKKEDAVKSGAECMFIEKYPDVVTVYTIGDVSKELCGGPHVKNTSELGKFKIKKEEASSAGVRRIKAILEK